MIKLKSLFLLKEEELMLAPLAKVETLVPQLLAAAQREYDAWDQSDTEFGDPDLGFGGICQNIAEEMAGVFNENGIESFTIDNGGVGEQHVWTVIRVQEGVYEIDIPPHLYERGGGYNWTKIPNVRFTEDFIHISKLDIPWEDITRDY